MSWSTKFDEPIPVAKGKALRTLRDAGTYIVALPPREAKQPRWQTAMKHLILAAEQGGIVLLARIAMMCALHAGGAGPAPRKKPAKKHRLSDKD